jgi:hypothetical protein
MVKSNCFIKKTEVPKQYDKHVPTTTLKAISGGSRGLAVPKNEQNMKLFEKCESKNVGDRDESDDDESDDDEDEKSRVVFEEIGPFTRFNENVRVLPARKRGPSASQGSTLTYSVKGPADRLRSPVLKSDLEPVETKTNVVTLANRRARPNSSFSSK